METKTESRGRVGRVVRSPGLAIVLVAPVLGEVLSTATPPLDLILPWNLALMTALYGSGALICREVARRFRFGLLGLCLLGAAYAVYEEALVDRFWFDPSFQEEAGIGAYSRVWHTNIMVATHLTAFHVAVSICASIVIVERLYPAHRERAWAGRRGLVFAAIALAAVALVTYEDFARVPAGQLIAAAGLCVLLVVCAFLVPRRVGRVRERKSRPRLLGFVAFVCTGAHFTLVYAMPSTGLPWPFGVALALAPIVVGVAVVWRMRTAGSEEGLRIVTGILAFFLLLDALVGLAGRFDLTIGAIALAFALWWLNRRRVLAG